MFDPFLGGDGSGGGRDRGFIFKTMIFKKNDFF